MSSISLDNAWLLLIAVPLIILIAVPFAIAIRKDNRNGHNVASCALHVLLAIIIAFSAAGVTIETTLTETNVFVVADVSYSANRNLDLIDEYIGALQNNLPNNSKMGVICFGKNSKMITEMGGKFTSVQDAFTDDENSDRKYSLAVDDSQTDIVQALLCAQENFRAGVIKRIVLITDCMQTGENGDDELKQTIDSLMSPASGEPIYIDAIYLNDNITGDVPEVQLSGVNCAQTAYKGRQSAATVTVQSSQTMYATVSLYETDGDVPIESRSILLGSGSSEVNFPLDSQRDAGIYNYKVTVVADNDLNPYNNSAFFTQEVEGNVKVLFITDVYADGNYAQEIFKGSDVELDVYCRNEAIPYTVADICDYDIVVLSNVDITKLDNYVMFVDSLETAVSMLGKSVIAIGDIGLQSNANADDAALAKLAGLLPVNYGNSGRGAKLYVMVIDCSHSMFLSDRLNHAKEAAQAILKILDEDDYLIIHKFYSENSAVWQGTVGNGEDASKAIDGIESLQGTVLNGGMEAVKNYYGSIGAGYSSTSVLVITDGLENTADYAYAIDTTRELYDMGVGTSVIDVGLDSDREYSKIYLDRIASYGGGSHYYYSYNENLSDEILPDISNEVGEDIASGKSLVNVSYKNYNDSVLDGLKEGGYITSSNDTLYYVEGYVVGSAKSSATSVLTTTYERNTGLNISVPIYSYWNYGNGRAASFMTGISGDWVANWSGRGILQTLFTDIVSSNVPQERLDTPYSVTLNKVNDSYNVEIAPVEVKSGATVKVTVTDPDGGEREITNVVFDSTVYTCSFATDTTGTYKLKIDYEYKGTEYKSCEYYANVSYLTEYNSFAAFDSLLLYKVLGSRGIISEDGKLTVQNDEGIISKRTVSLTVPLLIAAVVIFAVDIIIRKLKWNDVVSLFKKVNKGRKS